MKTINGYGAANAKIIVVGIAPAKEELEAGIPFVGPSGNILRDDLRECGIHLDNDCYRTNVFQVQLPNNEFARYSELGLNLTDNVARLHKEIQAINPNVILGLGAPPLEVLTGKKGTKNSITEWRGSILDVIGYKAVFTYHPAAQLHGEGEAGSFKPWQKYVRKFDVKRAVEQSKFREFKLPQRLLRIAQSSSDVYRFINSRASNYCAVDIEAIANIPVCIGLSFSPSEALSIPLWNTLNINCKDDVHPKKSYSYNLDVSSIPNSDLAYVWKILSNFFLNPEINFIGQNFKYDEDKLNKLGFYLHSLYADTLISQHCISSELPKSLAFQTSCYTLEPYYKFEGREFNPAKDRIRDLLLYNAKDACCTLEIWQAHVSELKSINAWDSFHSFRNKLHKAYSKLEQKGYQVDTIQRDKLIEKYVQRLIKLESEFKEITVGYGITTSINMASPKQLAVLFYEIMKIPKRAGTGEEVLTALMANTVKDPVKIRALEIVLEHRRVAKTIGTYLAVNLDYDGRLKTTYFITGTESFRTSTQILKPPLRDREIGWAIQTVTKHGDTGSDLRSILVADKGYVFINIDQSQAEARVCSLLASDEETLRLYDTNDIHALTASEIFGGTESSWSKKVLGFECPERFCGKTARHAYHLAIGKRELMINMNTDAKKYNIPLNISEWKAGQILEALRKMTPRIQDVYHAQIKEHLSKDRRLYGTFGASFYLFEDWGNDLFKAAYSRIPQQTVSDKTKMVMLACQKEIWDCPIVGESHDALLFLCPIRKVDDYVEFIQSQFAIPIDFSRCSLPRRSLVIPTDVELGENYEQLRKYRAIKTLQTARI